MHSLRRFHAALCLLILSVGLVPAAPALAQTSTEIRPVEFLLGGTVLEEGSAAPLERARIVVERQDDGTVLVDRAFTDAAGQYSVLFEAETEVTVGLGDDGEDDERPTETSVGGRWMGRMWPNPVSGEGDVRLTLPYAAPGSSAEAPELELFDMRGRRVGGEEVLASGVYFYRLRFGDRFVPARKLVVLEPTRPRVELVARRSATVSGDSGGDGLAKRASGQANVVVRVTRPGHLPFETTWTVDSEVQNVVDATLGVEPDPTAGLQVGGTLEAEQAVLFDGSSSVAADGQSLDYSWDFGDGQMGGGEQVAHVYAAAGSYDVLLTVTATHGATDSVSTQITIVPPPDPVTTGAELVGSITDVAGNLLEGVVGTIVGHSPADTSLADGSLTLEGVPTGIPLSIRLSKPGFAEQVVRLVLPDSTEFSTFESTLAPRRTAVVLPRIEDGELCRGADGATVDLPPDALLRPDGSPATGEARLSVTPLDMSDERESFAFPGGFEGVQTTGNRGLIVSYGVMEVVFEQEGEELQLAPGRSAGVEIPVYSSSAEVGDTIALWSVDPNTGLWREEGAGTVVANDASPTGLALEAQVTHFSWWNADKFDDDPYRPIPRCKIKDQNGLPTLDIPSGGACYINGRVTGGGGPWGNPDTNVPPAGGVPLPVPANQDFQLTATAANGTQRGTIVVNGPPGVTEEVIVPLDPVGGGGGALVLPTEEFASIDPAGEVDTYTFDVAEGQHFNVAVKTAEGSFLEGLVRLRDPNGAAVDSATFRNDDPGGLARQASIGGEWTIEIDGTANEPGAYELLARFVSPIDATLPSILEIESEPGWVQPIRLEAQAGDWMSIDSRRLAGTGGRGGVRILAPSGEEVFDGGFTFSFQHLGLILLEETGTYEIDFSSRDLSGISVLSLRDVPEIGFGQTIEASLEEESVRYYRTPAATGDAMNAVLEELGSFRGNVQVVDEQQQSAFTTIQFGTNLFTGVRYPDDDGPWFLRVSSSFRTDDRSLRDYRVRLDEVRSPAPLFFDATGRNETTLSLDRVGHIRLLRLEANAGDGLWTQLLETANPSPGQNTTLELYRVGSGEPLDPQENQSEGHRFSGDTGDAVLEGVSYRLAEAGTYVLAIASTSATTGEFQLRIDRVGASSAITVDDDLVECPDADTRSLEAALAAILPDGVVSVCEGEYVSPESYQALAGPITLEGAGRELTIVSARSRFNNASVMVFSEGLTALRDLRIESRGSGINRGVHLFSASGTVFERLDLVAADGTPTLDVGIDLSSVDDVVVRDCTIERAFRVIEASNCPRILVEDNVFSQSSTMVDLENCDEAVVQRNSFDCDDVGQVITFSSSAGGQFLDNDITVATSDIGARLGTAALQIDDDDDTGAFADTVIRGNTVITNEEGISSEVRQGSSGLVVEQNLFRNTSTRGEPAASFFGTRLDPDTTLLVRNNVFDGFSLFDQVRVFNADRLTDVQIVNNSFRTAPGSLTGTDYVFLEITVSDGSYTGGLPLVLANNVVAGVDAGIGISLPTGVTIDADWNLFDGFPVLYDGGSTSTGTNDLIDVDPLFADDDLRLQAASPAVDSGASSSQVASVPAVDLEGTARPQGAGVDRGAYEQ